MEIILKYFSDFTEQQLKQLAGLEELYKNWNSKINVISRKDIDGLYEKHVLHSLSIAAVFDFVDGTEVIDIGTGGGFPGIPLAIFFPQARFHLIDSIAKKLKVVQEVAAGLGLKNVTTQHIRVEEIRGRKFDFAVSRAVAPLKELWKWSKPLLKKSKFYPDSHRDPNPKSDEHQNQNRVFESGLICLKGGDLALEISESGIKPRMMEISKIFAEDYFREKYLLYVPRAGSLFTL